MKRVTLVAEVLFYEKNKQEVIVPDQVFKDIDSRDVEELKKKVVSLYPGGIIKFRIVGEKL